MKKYIPFFIIVSVLFSSCNIDGDNEKVSFEKKKYCFEIRIEGVNEDLIAEKFYSPIKDSCIYKYADGSKYQKVIDALTKEIIETNQGDIERNAIVDRKIQELKGEKIVNNTPLPDGYEGTTSSGAKFKVSYE